MQVQRKTLLTRNILDAFERASVQGHWRPGNTAGPRLFFSMTFVAAMMVGGIQLFYRKDLGSNKFSFTPSCHMSRKSTLYEYQEPVGLCMGQEMGSFNFGSTVVLVRCNAGWLYSARAARSLRLGVDRISAFYL